VDTDGDGVKEDFATNYAINAKVAGYHDAGLTISSCYNKLFRFKNPANTVYIMDSHNSILFTMYDLYPSASVIINKLPYVFRHSNFAGGNFLDGHASNIYKPTATSWNAWKDIDYQWEADL